MMTAEQIDKVMEEVRTFSSKNIGVTNGWDYGEFVKVLYDSKKFEDLLCYVSSVVTVQMLQLDDSKSMDDIVKMMKNGPKQAVAQAIYIGYRLGQEAAEMRELEKMAK